MLKMLISPSIYLKKKKKERKTLRSYFAILTTLSISVSVSKNFVICQVKNRNYFLFMTNSFPNDLLNGKRDVLFNWHFQSAITDFQFSWNWFPLVSQANFNRQLNFCNKEFLFIRKKMYIKDIDLLTF